jgi:N-formylglutamate amidohydrolase
MQPFIVREPTSEIVPLVVSIPHAGTHLPDALRARLESDAMRALPMTDWHLMELYDFLPALGVTTLMTPWSRFYVDLNRAPVERPLYPGRFETGLIALQDFQGAQVWRDPPSADETMEHRAAVHAPYHARLLTLLSTVRQRCGGKVWLIDAHSVASRANKLHGELADEIFLGDRDGASCADWFMAAVDDAFKRRKRKVSRNQPYKGGYITDNYGRVPGTMALQIEMAQRVYMDEADPAGALSHPNFAKAKADLQAVFDEVVKAIAARGAVAA